MKDLKVTDIICFVTLKYCVVFNTFAFFLQSLLKFTDSFEQGT